ncbi:MAG: DUF4159 domain-containing protein [Candidatus Latescibacterota bacterium]
MPSRFASPASSFDLDEIVRRLRTTFLISMASAAIVHLAIVGINPFEEAKTRAPRPMVTKFIKREPRLTKPLELRKIPQPKRQLARRQVRLAQARMDQVQATATFNTRSLIASHVGDSGIRLAARANFGALTTSTLEPKLVPLAVTSTHDAEHRIDMALEMLDVNNMDTGRYRAIIIQDASDKQALKGFVKFAQVMSARYQGRSARVREVDRLRDVVNEYTGLHADFLGLITYDDPRLLEVPIILPQGSPNEAELENLAEYLLAGGFVIGDLEEAVPVLLEGWEEALEKYGGLVPGKDFWSERLPEHHAIFTAFFDLSGGVPFGFRGGGGKNVRRWNFVTGHFVKGRLVGVTPGDGGWGWKSDLRGSGEAQWTRQLQLTVNIIVYALTQEGSITQRLMQMVN